MGKVYSKEELQEIGNMCVRHQIIILSDEVYDRLYYVPFTRIATLDPEVEKLTLTVGSAGKNFYATGWRVGTCNILRFQNVESEATSPLLVTFADDLQDGSWDQLSSSNMSPQHIHESASHPSPHCKKPVPLDSSRPRSSGSGMRQSRT